MKNNYSNRLPIVKNSHELPHHLTKNQFEKIKHAINQDFENKKNPTAFATHKRHRNITMIDLMWITGARAGDICKFKKQDIDVDQKQLKIYMQKVKRNVIVTISQNFLIDLLNYCQFWEIKEYLFTKYQQNKPLARQRVWGIIREYGTKAGLGPVHPHQFRHGSALFMLSQGIPINVISARLGHSDPMTTMRMYLKVTPDIQRQMLSEVQFR